MSRTEEKGREDRGGEQTCANTVTIKNMLVSRSGCSYGVGSTVAGYRGIRGEEHK